MVLPCQALGIVLIEQKDNGPWVRNDRLIVSLACELSEKRPKNARRLPSDATAELEQFFVNTSYFTAKKIRLLGWRGPRAALRAVEEARGCKKAQDRQMRRFGKRNR